MKWMLVTLALAGCARSTDAMNGEGRDLSAVGGNGAGTGDLALGGGGGGDDLAQSSSSSDLAGAAADLAQPIQDLAQPIQDLAQPPDLAQSSSDVTVHVLIDNFCNSSTNPTVINAPLHVALNLTFVNDSHDYHSDIWSSRGYGFLDLPLGAVWHDPIQHCLNPNPYTEYFDVGIQGGPVGGSCPNYRLQIHCN
ncbi:MAG: hypothetical protein ACXVDD_17715 [Polyangia bacterium]